MILKALEIRRPQQRGVLIISKKINRNPTGLL